MLPRIMLRYSPRADWMTALHTPGRSLFSCSPMGHIVLTLLSGLLAAPLVGCGEVPESPEASTSAIETNTPVTLVDDSFATRIQMRFERNDGQTDGQVQYLARGNEYTIFFTSDEAVVALAQLDLEADDSEARSRQAVMRFSWSGANRDVRVVGDQLLTATSHYFRGTEERWRVNIPNYARVKYEDLYPGVDLYYYGRDGQLEYKLVAEPGANVRAFRFSVDGVDDVSIDRQGRLVFMLGTTPMYQLPPVAYQMIDGKQVAVESQYRMVGDDEVGISLEDFDDGFELVIDPVLNLSGEYGGSDDDTVSDMAMDEEGNLYLVGQTWSTDFPTQGGYDDSFNGSSTDAFLLKVDGRGEVLYATYLGGSTGGTSGYVGWDTASAVAVDPAGRAYVTGYTYASDFPTTEGSYQPEARGGTTDTFVTCFSAGGAALVYSTYLGGSDNEAAEGIAVNGKGAAYVTGYTYSMDFPVTEGVAQETNHGWSDAFVTKLSASGSELVYSTYLGGSAGSGGTWGDYGKGIVLDEADNAYVVGHTLSMDYPTTEGAYRTNRAGSYDAFVTILDRFANVVYSTYFGGTSMEVLSGIAVGPGGTVYITGTTLSEDLPTSSGVVQESFGGGSYDAFLARLDPSLEGEDGLVFATYLGGSTYDYGRDVAVDGEGNALVVGYTESPDFPVTAGALQTIFAGDYDAVGTRISADGRSLMYSTFLGGDGGDGASAVVVDANGDGYVAGKTRSVDFFSEDPSSQSASVSDQTDIFIAKLALPRAATD